MLEKFQKLFGPNPPRAIDAQLSAPADIAASQQQADAEHRKQQMRLRNRRRYLGLAILLMAAAIVLPSILEPNPTITGAKLDIPERVAPAHEGKVVNLPDDQQKSQVVQVEPEPAKVVLEKPEAEEALKQAEVVLDKTTNKDENAIKSTAKTDQTPIDAKAVQPSSNKGVSDVKPKTVPSESASKSTAKPVETAAKANVADNSTGKYFIQVVATGNQQAARDLTSQLQRLGLPAYIESVQRRGSDLWRVRVGRFKTEAEARHALDILALNGIDNGGLSTLN